MSYPFYKSLGDFYAQHEKPLAAAMHRIERRGLKVDSSALATLKQEIQTSLESHCTKISTIAGRPVAISKADAEKLGTGTVNLASTPQLISLFKSIGLKLYRNRLTGNESTGEEFLHRMFAETNSDVVASVLEIRELLKIRGTYVNARLKDNCLFSIYIVGGTVTGRRSSRGNPLGYGTNHQNIPHHSELGRKFNRCLIARSGKIFVKCDQVAAEDWIINGIITDLTGDTHGIDELRGGIDRHQRLASFIFKVPLDQCSRDSKTPYRYIGKRTRYAGCYGMGGEKFSAVLAKEGYAVPKDNCEYILSQFHQFDPGIQSVFQAYVEREITNNRLLRNLFGRERQFFGLHPFRDNSKIFREAYSYIPQGTIGDNTGEAMLYFDKNAPDYPVVLETHDAIALEVDDEDSVIYNALQHLEKAFDRTLTFPNGLELKIPIESEVGYNLEDTVRCESSNQAGLITTLNTYRQRLKVPMITTSGVAQPLLQQA